MAITLTQDPGEYNLAYGINAVTLNGLTTEDKYVLQILDGSTVVADIRQTPNENGTANFDIQNILQSYVGPTGFNIEDDPINFYTTQDEVFEYNIAYGTETGGEIDTPLNIEIGLKVIGGRKEYYELNFDKLPFTAYAAGSDSLGNCTEIPIQGRAFTDWTEYRLISEITDGAPTWSQPTDRVYTQKVRATDGFTLSLLNDIATSLPAPNPDVDKIEAMRFNFYQADGTPITELLKFNLLENQEGSRIVTATVGPANLLSIPAGTSHYYVGFPLKTDEDCGTDEDNLTDRSAMGFYRFDIVDDKCNDYTPIQFSWMNSYGFRDYFFFEKRNERTVGISRNNYLAEPNDYSIGTFSSPIYGRGYTTYSQKLEERYVANTRFLQDYEAAFLENLFISPDVKVRFGDDTDWFPVTLLTTTFTERNYRKDKLFQYEISFKKAHNIKSQRG